MPTYYHVTREWDGGDLKSLKQRIDDGEMGLDTWEEIQEYLLAKWGIDTEQECLRYLAGDGSQVHMHETLDEAIAYRDEYCPGGVILAYDDEDGEAGVGEECGQPVFGRPVEAHWLKVVEFEAA